MIKIKHIIVDRAEGPSELCVSKTVNTFLAANTILRRNAETAPKGGAYDKHDITIIYDDGHTYEARIDVHHPSYEKTETVEGHIIFHCKFHGGLLKDCEIPKHLTLEKYREIVNWSTAEEIQEYRKFLANYQLED